PIIFEGLFELVLDIVWIVGELHERGVIAGAAATGEVRIVLRLPRVVGELLAVTDAAATSEARIILARIVGELHERGVIAGAAATGEVRTGLRRAWVGGELDGGGGGGGAAAAGGAPVRTQRVSR